MKKGNVKTLHKRRFSVLRRRTEESGRRVFLISLSCWFTNFSVMFYASCFYLSAVNPQTPPSTVAFVLLSALLANSKRSRIFSIVWCGNVWLTSPCTGVEVDWAHCVGGGEWVSERVTMVNRKSKWEKNENEGILVRICLGGRTGTTFVLYWWKCRKSY